MKHFRTIAIMLLALGAGGMGGCATGTGPNLEGLERARARWAAQGVDSYEVDVRRLCFCAFDVTRAVRVHVANGHATARTYIDTGEPVVQDPELFPDIPGLFDLIEEAIDQDAHSIEVDYDSDLGYPLSISIDYLEHAVDEELTMIVDRFHPLRGS